MTCFKPGVSGWNGLKNNEPLPSEGVHYPKPKPTETDRTTISVNLNVAIKQQVALVNNFFCQSFP